MTPLQIVPDPPLPAPIDPSVSGLDPSLTWFLLSALVLAILIFVLTIRFARKKQAEAKMQRDGRA
jgi:cytochrome oxidase assembly protein ShyY1